MGFSPVLPFKDEVKRVFQESAGYFASRAAVATYTTGGAFFLAYFQRLLNWPILMPPSNFIGALKGYARPLRRLCTHSWLVQATKCCLLVFS